jgi:hypothetical protein
LGHLTTYAGLQAAVSDELRRAADSVFQARLPRLVAQAEQQIARDLRCKEREGSAIVQTVAGQAAALAPADLSIVCSVTFPNCPPLRQVSPEAFDGAHGERSGPPKEFAYWAGSFLFGPTPDGVYGATVRYFKVLPKLSVTDAHPVFLAHWDVYFYATLLAAAPGLVDDERVLLWAKFYDGAIGAVHDDAVESLSAGARTRRAYGGSR